MTRQEEFNLKVDTIEENIATIINRLDALVTGSIRVADLEKNNQTTNARVDELADNFRETVGTLREEVRISTEDVRNEMVNYATVEAVDELRQQVALLTRAVANAPAPAPAPAQAHVAHPKVPDPQAFTGVRDAKLLENFIFDLK